MCHIDPPIVDSLTYYPPSSVTICLLLWKVYLVILQYFQNFPNKFQNFLFVPEICSNDSKTIKFCKEDDKFESGGQQSDKFEAVKAASREPA